MTSETGINALRPVHVSKEIEFHQSQNNLQEMCRSVLREPNKPHIFRLRVNETGETLDTIWDYTFPKPTDQAQRHKVEVHVKTIGQDSETLRRLRLTFQKKAGHTIGSSPQWEISEGYSNQQEPADKLIFRLRFLFAAIDDILSSEIANFVNQPVDREFFAINSVMEDIPNMLRGYVRDNTHPGYAIWRKVFYPTA